MANILCIDPGAKFNAYGMFLKFPVLGLLYVSTVLKRLGHDVEIISESFGRIYDTAKDTISPILSDRLKHADVFALSAMTPTANRCYSLADKARSIVPNIKILMGGPHVSYREEEALEYADVVVKGEGEAILEKALETESGVVQAPSLITDLDSLPFPDFSLIKGYMDWLRGKCTKVWRFWEKIYPRYVPILGSRGCPFDCTFCIVTQMCGRKYRFRDPESVVDEIEMRIKEGAVPHFFFCDDNFPANPTRTKKLLRLIHERIISKEGLGRNDFMFVAEARADIAKDEELLQLMEKAHCYYLYIGFESINPQTLLAFNKRQTVEDIKWCVSRVKAHRIKIQGMFIVGGDDDTPETMIETVAFAREVGIDTIQISILFPIPGTKLYSTLEKEGRILTHDWSLFDGTVVVFEPESMTMRQLQEGCLRAWKRFYLRIRKIKYAPAIAIGSMWWEKIHRASFEKLAQRFNR